MRTTKIAERVTVSTTAAASPVEAFVDQEFATSGQPPTVVYDDQPNHEDEITITVVPRFMDIYWRDLKTGVLLLSGITLFVLLFWTGIGAAWAAFGAVFSWWLANRVTPDSWAIAAATGLAKIEPSVKLGHWAAVVLTVLLTVLTVNWEMDPMLILVSGVFAYVGVTLTVCAAHIFWITREGGPTRS